MHGTNFRSGTYGESPAIPERPQTLAYLEICLLQIRDHFREIWAYRLRVLKETVPEKEGYGCHWKPFAFHLNTMRCP
jgi:hypothetical protein